MNQNKRGHKVGKKPPLKHVGGSRKRAYKVASAEAVPVRRRSYKPDLFPKGKGTGNDEVGRLESKRREKIMPAVREISADKKTIKIQFADGATFGPIENTPTNEVLTKMIALLDSRLANLNERLEKLEFRR